MNLICLILMSTAHHFLGLALHQGGGSGNGPHTIVQREEARTRIGFQDGPNEVPDLPPPVVGPEFLWGTPAESIIGDGAAAFTPADEEGNTVNMSASHNGGTDDPFSIAEAVNEGTFDWQSAETVDCNLHVEVAASHEPGAVPPEPNVGWVCQISILSEDGMSSESLVNEGGTTLGNNGTFDIPFTLPVRVIERAVDWSASVVVSGQPGQAMNAGNVTVEATFSLI